MHRHHEAGKPLALRCKPALTPLPRAQTLPVLLCCRPRLPTPRSPLHRVSRRLPTEPGQLPAVLAGGEEAKKPPLWKQL